MKKLLCFVLLLILVCSNVYAETNKEITFLDIPWFSDEYTAFQELSNKGYIRSGVGIFELEIENSFYLMRDADGIIMPTIDNDNSGYCFSTTLTESAKGKIAGYPVASITMTFAYNGSYQLVYAKINMLGADYADIKDKLGRVYGKCGEYETFEGIKLSYWEGLNDTCILLYTDNDGKSFDLCYGSLKTTEILAQSHITDSKDVSGL